MIKGDDCIRRKIVIEDENYYLTIGKTFLHATIPFENAPRQSKIRGIIEQICEAVSEVRQDMADREVGE